MKYQYDLLVIGSGSAGFSAASSAKGHGRKIGMVESGRLGGECPNWACVPTKVLLKSASVYREAKKALDYGVLVNDAKMDFKRIMARRSTIVDGLGGPRIEKLADNLGIDVIRGRAVFLDAHTVQVDEQTYTSDKFIIATGSRTFVPPIPGIEKTPWLDFSDAVMLDAPPESLVIVGGGPVGCEFATFFATLGVNVTLVQGAAHLLNREEPEISEVIEESMRALGVELHLNAEVVEAEGDADRVSLKVRVGKSIETVSAGTLLMATGKTSNTAGLGCKAAGVELDHRGTIRTNTELRTSVDNIWAAGDVNGGMQFTHTAHHEGNLAGFNAFAKKALRYSEKVVPRATFVVPEVASVGVTQAEAEADTKAILVGTFSMAGLGRAYIDGASKGLVKIVADKKTRKILGGHVCGPRAGEVVHEIALAMYGNLTVDDLAEMIHAYPTYSEAVTAAASVAVMSE